MIITRAEMEDTKEILDLQKLAYRSEAEIYHDDMIPPLTQTLEEIRGDFERQVFLKASVEGKIIGSVRAHLREGTCFIGRLIVHPGFQRRGIGTKLMEEVERVFGQALRFELFTGQKSEQNISFYKRLGYQPFKIEKVNERLALLHMEKVLMNR